MVKIDKKIQKFINNRHKSQKMTENVQPSQEVLVEFAQRIDIMKSLQLMKLNNKKER